MCGICGIYLHNSAASVATEQITRMRDTMEHRGPDSDGLFTAAGLALGHRRLRIIDLSDAGVQPMFNDDRSLSIVYNGEIYNFRELRAELEARGVVFRSKCDTEVVLRLYEADGPGMVSRLNGIFAFAIYDSRDDSLFCARDHLGVKPFYYSIQSDRFLFASEMKALLAGGVHARVNRDAVAEFLVFRYTSGARTLFDGVHRLEPGCTLRVRRGGVEHQRYWSVFNTTASSAHATRADDLGPMLSAAVSRQMISDVAVGTMCSGGLDSSGLTALAAQQAGSLMNTFSISFAEAEYSEARFAKAVSEYYQTRHHDLRSDVESFGELLPRLIWQHDEPLMHPNSVPIYQISRVAKQEVTVLLSGEGADEVFGGYYWQSRFERIRRARQWGRAVAAGARPLFGRAGRFRWERLSAAIAQPDLANTMVWSGALASPAQLGAIGYHGNWNWSSRIDAANNALAASNDSTQARILYDQLNYLGPLLDRQDKMCMAASIESRVPYLDVRLVEFANRLPTTDKISRTNNKIALRRALQPHLPPQISTRAKFGFGVPVDQWLRSPAGLRPTLEQMASRSSGVACLDLQLFDADKLRTAITDYLQRDADLGAVLWSVLNLELWLRAFDVSDRTAIAA